MSRTNRPIFMWTDDLSANFWLDAVAPARNFGFGARELNTLQSLGEANRKQLLEAWYEFFGDSRG